MNSEVVELTTRERMRKKLIAEMSDWTASGLHSRDFEEFMELAIDGLIGLKDKTDEQLIKEVKDMYTECNSDLLVYKLAVELEAEIAVEQELLSEPCVNCGSFVQHNNCEDLHTDDCDCDLCVS